MAARSMIFLFLALVIIYSPAVNAQTQINPKAVDSITVRITQSGQLDVEGYIEDARLSLYIPQEGVQEVKVKSSSAVVWRYSNDTSGNRIIILEWKNPSGVVTYRTEITVRNSAKSITPAPIGYDQLYLNTTKSIVLSGDIRRAAYPFEKTWENVARLTEFVHELVDYDSSLVGERKPSDWVFENKRGVCVEHANLLTALLRASGIPTRYVVGYAYSVVDNKLIGHTWVEVLDENGNWIPFDPTWLQGGYLDATHIKTANLLDDNQLDVLSYKGRGRIIWTRGGAEGSSRRLTGDLYSDDVEILEFTQRNITSLLLSAPPPTAGGYGYIKTVTKHDACTINHVTAQSCIDSSGKNVFELFEKERKFYSCSSEEIYWFYRETAGRTDYICPVAVFDQFGSSQDIEIRPRADGIKGVSISGPDTVDVGESFTLSADADRGFIFYSPDFGRSENRLWRLELSRPGSHSFYLYSDGGLAIKTVRAVERKEFDLSVAAPQSVKEGEGFTVNITARNIGSAKDSILKIEFDGAGTERITSFLPGEEKILAINMTAAAPGQKQVYVSILGDTLTSYSTAINIEGKENILQSILKSILGFLSSITGFFSSLKIF